MSAVPAVSEFALHDIKGAVDGQDARILAARSRGAKAGVLHICLDDARMASLAEVIAFFAPDQRILCLPAWDCLPYDRVSPKAEITTARIDTLSALAAGDISQTIVLTTINAAMQRVPPRSIFVDATLTLRKNGRLGGESFEKFLITNGYVRAHTVREPGEYAQRGGIIDLYPPGVPAPIRIDLFGDEIETIRYFDPVSQRSTEDVSNVILKPVTEYIMTSDAIQRFRTGYRELFGAVNDGDPLYESISAGRRFTGMEHWLPLFFDRMDTVFDYLPHAIISFDHQFQAACEARLEQVTDFYQARHSVMKAKNTGGHPYKPLPPERLYLSRADWQECLAGRGPSQFVPFAGMGEEMSALGAKIGPDFTAERTSGAKELYQALKQQIQLHRKEGRRVLLAAYSFGSRERMASLMRDHSLPPTVMIDCYHDMDKVTGSDVPMAILPLEKGFVARDMIVMTEQDILGDRLARRNKSRKKSDKFLMEVSALSEGDLVVHAEHGIGRFEGLETLTVSGAPHDCLRIIYEGGDKLYVPVENIDVLTRFGSEDAAANLDKLGGAGWQARKARVKKRLKDMAAELIRIAAARLTRQTSPIVAPDGTYGEFCASFPYAETEDQLGAIDDVVHDLASGVPMDRLICGDVGFGKTEVAIRAAFVAAMSGVQVAVIAPTTLLVRQHVRNFTNRFKHLPIRVHSLSRLVSAKDVKVTKEAMRDGTVDIVIGTHALLAKDVAFKNLGLVIVDEEQHFGVKQKEKLKQLRADVHVLTLTATPIPRTLQLALTGVRELSLITTPPVDRLAVRTYVLPYDPVVLREALMREHFRGGQAFYVCPRIQDLDDVVEKLKNLVPEMRIVVAHGQMAASDLEDVMTAFDERSYDILVATNIIESGLDIPNANTIIIHKADLFGLAQLYQLRGRVGRSKTRGYAYITYDPSRKLTKLAEKRLQVLETLDTLGAGFNLASYDMDIRGAGNLLGEEQSGHIREVGIELYQQMLQEAVEAARYQQDGLEAVETPDEWSPQINVAMPILIPEEYVSDLNVRLSLYRRLSDVQGDADIDSFAAELADRFGPLPQEVENLLSVIDIKRLCRLAGVDRIDAGPKGAIIAFRKNEFKNVTGLMGYIHKNKGLMKIRPDQKITVLGGWEDRKKRLQSIRILVQELADLVVSL